MKQTLLVANLILSAAFLATAQKTPESMLGAAMHQEEVQGDLKGAIASYQKVVAAPGVSRKTAADALVRMGQCYEKLGDAESRKAYERVVREYSDQKAAAAMARARLGRNAPANSENGIVTRQVWPDASDDEGGPSPDGHLLSFVDWTTGDLAVRDLASGKNRRLTNKGTWEASEEFALFSVFSPDGKQIAFSWFNSDRTWDIRVLSVEDAGLPKPRVLYHGQNLEYPEPCDWSKDGQQILAFLRMQDQTHRIALVSTVDGSTRILKTLDWRAPTKMSLSPDGRYIAYDFPPEEDSRQRDIFVLAVDGSRESVLVGHPANDLAPIWTPDGKRIVFTSDRSGSMAAWIVAVADGKSQGVPELLKADVGRIAPMAFTRKGALFYSLVIGDSGVYIATMDQASGKIGEPKGITERFSGQNMSPDWSPDGRFLAFASIRSFAREPGSTVICIRALGNGEQRELRPELSYFQDLRWSPDGKSLVLWGTDRKGRKGIFQVDAVTGMLSTIVATGDDLRGPVWSPDGQLLYYFDYGNGRVVARDRETGREKELLPRGRLAVRRLTLSPDGQQLAMLVLHLEKKSGAIDVMPANGGEPREIISLPDARMPEWAPDSRHIIFARDNGSSTDLWRISAEGGEPAKIALGMTKFLRNLRIHPDAQQVAFNSSSTKAEIWVMENFLPAQRASK